MKRLYILTVVILLISLVSSAYAQTKPDVLLVAAESTLLQRDDVVNKLTATESFSSVVFYDGVLATPTVGELQSYDVVLIWANSFFLAPDVLGDNLATYIEGGGHVINMVFAIGGGSSIQGNFAANYELIQSGSHTSGVAGLGDIIEPLHPLINNINVFNGGTSAFRSTGAVVNGSVIAKWNDGLPLIVAQENVGPALTRRVDLNFWPVSSDAFASNWDATGQGTEIMENAIIWVVDRFRKVTVGEIATDIGQSYDAVWADYDNDGFQDLFVPDKNVANSDKLYHNNGDGTFTSVIAGDLGTDADVSFGATWGDYDNDGDPDLFVAVGGFSNTNSNRLFQNNGDGTFSSITAGDLGADALGATGGAWADFDNDGFLDLAVSNYSAAVSLYHNNGNGTFSLNANFTPADVGSLWSLAWGDFNGDNKPDLYVSNYGGENFMYQNDGGGFFTRKFSVPYATDITNNYSAAFIDIDNDGDEDIFVPVYGADNKLYINDGSGFFTSDLANPIVIEPGNSWSASWGDFNNDGRKDLYIGNEFGPGSLFRNDGGTSFTKISSTIVSKDVGTGSGTLASAWCDIDNDGDVDLFTSVYDGENNFYINELDNNNNWVDIKLGGTVSNHSAIGAQIKLTNTNGNTITQTVTTQNGRGQSSVNVHVGLGSYSISDITILWPSGLAQSVKAGSNQFINIIEGDTDDRPTVLALGAEGNDTWAFDVRDKLIESGDFSVVSIYGAQSSTPTLSELESFDAVFVWSQGQFLDPITIGDNLADYIDGGGAVVSAVFANASIAIEGRFAPAYELIVPLDQLNGQLTLGTIPLPDHPLMNRVSSFDGGTSSFRSSSTTLSSGSQVVAEWSDGSPLIVIKEGVGNSNAKRVDLNFWPTSSDGFASNWVSTTDGARIMANALLWTLSAPDQFTKVAPGAVINADLGSSWGNAWGDFNGNGHLDLFVGNQGQADLLYQNNGDGTFTKNITDASVLPVTSSRAPVWGDYDNDGNLDLFVPNNGTSNILYRNNGSGALIEAINFGDTDISINGAWGDYDGDGYLDLFVGNLGNNRLYKNNQDGSFTEITDLEIVESNLITFGASWGDYDDDGFLDLFIAEWNGINILLHNNGDDTFTRVISGEIVTGIANSIGASWGDYDNDADLDLFVANNGQDNALYQNNGDGSFTKVTEQANMIDAASNSAGASWEDFDNDGYLDLFVATEINANNILYQNNGDGTFSSIKLWAPTMDAKPSSGSSWADYDNDGDVDLFVSTGSSGEPNLFYQNNGNSNNWINIVLEGVESNRSAIGAKLYITTANGTQFREVVSQTGFGSQNSLNLEFGLATATVIDQIEINWPSGRDQFLQNISVNQFLTIIEDVIPPTAFTTGIVLANATNPLNVAAGYLNSFTTRVEITVPIANDPSLEGGTIQIQAKIGTSGAFIDVGAPNSIVSTSLGTNQIANVTLAELQASPDFAQYSTIVFRAVLTDAATNQTIGIESASTLIIKTVAPVQFTTGTVLTTAADPLNIAAGYINSFTTGVNITVPIANDLSLDGGTIKIQAKIGTSGAFIDIGAPVSIASTSLGTNQVANLTLVELQSSPDFAENSTIVFRAVLTDVAKNQTIGTESVSTLIIYTTPLTDFTTDVVVSVGGNVIANYLNAGNTGADIMVPIANNIYLDAGTIQIQAKIGTSGSFTNVGGPISIASTSLGTNQVASVTLAELQASSDFAENLTIVFRAVLTDVASNQIVGTESASTLIIDTVAPGQFTTGSVTTTAADPAFIVARYWNKLNTGVNIIVPIADDQSLDGGLLQLNRNIDGIGIDILGSPITILTADLGTDKTVSLVKADFEEITGLVEGSKISIVASLADIAGNPVTLGDYSTDIITIDRIAPAFNIANSSIATTYVSGQSTQSRLSTIADTSGIKEVVIHYNLISSHLPDEFNMLILTKDVANNFVINHDEIIQDNSEQHGIIYYLEILDNAGNKYSGVADKQPVNIKYPNGITVQNFGVGSTTGDYKMMAIPLDLESKSVNDVFDEVYGGTFDDSKMRIFSYAGGNATTYNELSGSSPLNMGIGYFALVANSVSVTSPAGATSFGAFQNPDLLETQGYSIDLVAGWNMIGNPFMHSLNWAEVEFVSNVTPGDLDAPQIYNGSSFPSVASIPASSGAFIHNNTTSTISIKIPARRITGGRVASSTPNHNSLIEDSWGVIFTAKGKEATAFNLGGIGMEPEANFSKDQFDLLNPPSFSSMKVMDFNHPEFSVHSFKMDVRETAAEEKWEFDYKVETLSGEKQSINWDNSYFGDNSPDLYLIDKTHFTTINMKEVNTYTFSHMGTTQFEVYFGYDVLDKLLPKELITQSPFPNPFTNEISFNIGLTDGGAATIEIRIFNSVGKVIRIITRSDVAAGYSSINWNGLSKEGAEIPVGLYAYSIHIKGSTVDMVKNGKIIKK